MPSLEVGQVVEHIKYGEGVVVDPKNDAPTVQVEWPDGEVSLVRKDRLLAPETETRDFAAELGFIRLTQTSGKPAYVHREAVRNVWVRTEVNEAPVVGISHSPYHTRTLHEKAVTRVESGLDGSSFEVTEEPEQIFMLLAKSVEG